LKDVVCVGVVTVDVFLRSVPRSLSPGDYVFLSDAQLHPGGTALNTAIDAVRLGMKASVIGYVGQDLAGSLILNVLEKEGVDVSGLCPSPNTGTPSWYLVTAPDGQQLEYYYGGSNDVLTETDVSDAVLRNCRVLHAAGSQHLPAMDGEPTARLLERAHKAGCITTLDPTENTTPENKYLLLPPLPHLDYFFPNLDQALVVTEASSAEEAADELLAAGVGTVVIKMGDQGCLIASSQERLRIPAYSVEVVDATGAGDALIAGFLLARLNGWSLARAGRVGNAMGAQIAQAVGPISMAVTQEKLFAFLDERDPEWRQL